MILNSFPDLAWLKQQAEQRFANRQAWGGGYLPTAGWPSVILNARTQLTYRDNIRGPLSLFYNVTGISRVMHGNKRVTVGKGLFYLTNPDEHYTLEVESQTPVETFNIHFGEYFADQVIEAYSKSPENLLDNHFHTRHQPMAFHSKLTPLTPGLQHSLSQMKDVGSALGREEMLAAVLMHLVSDEQGVRKIKQQLPVLKASTREEIMHRLHLATDYMHTFYEQPVTLDTLAEIACLSKFHFLRLFKLAFRKTPHQFITELRLDKARQLLKHTKLDIQEVSRVIGFDNASSFSRLFKNHVGVYPSQYRD